MLNVVLVTLGDPGQLSGGYLYNHRIAGFGPQNDARLESIGIPKTALPRQVLDARDCLHRALETRPDAIVVDSICAALLAPWLGRARRRTKLVALLHQPPGGIDYGPVKQRLSAALDMQAYRQVRLLMVASGTLEEEMRARGFPRDRVVLVAPGRDPGEEGPPVALDLRQGREVAFLCVANWQVRKGIIDLLDAFARLPAAAGTLNLVGATDVEPAYAALVRGRLRHPDLAGRVTVHGARPPGEMPSYYRAADVFVLASTKEPYGTVYSEAMAAGLPVVGWNAGNLPYLAEDGREGLVVPPADRDGLSEALATLASDPALRAGMGAAALSRAATFPTWEESARRFYGVISGIS